MPEEIHEIMGKLSTVWNYIRRHKYGIVIVFFILLMGFLDENSLWERYHHRVELNNLRADIRKYKEMYEHDTKYLEEMHTNPEIMTKIARERYYMKTDDEDIFIIEEDNGDDEEE